MTARIVPPYPDGPEDPGPMSVHVECEECGTEWGWARDVPSAYERLGRMVDEHNFENHGHRRGQS